MVITQEGPGFRHEALPYGADATMVDQVTRFLSPALEKGEPVLIATKADSLSSLEKAFHGHDLVDLTPMEEVGRNPGRLIWLWQDFLDRNGAEERIVWGIGEPIYAGRDAAELAEGQIHERLLNRAFNGSQFALHLGCPYDMSSLPGDVADEMGRSHPFIANGAGSRDNEGFQPADQEAPPAPLGPALIPDEAFIPFDEQSLGRMRRQLAGEARICGVDETRIPDLLLAVNEIATNSILYAGAGSLGVWQDSGRIICEVRDQGFIDDDLVGRLRPAVTEEQGRGIWFAHQVADLLQFRSAPSGTQWRVIFDCGSPR
ncbi:MAG TPA: anti-sigma factor RsbA family regulatory protein [Acidimicrobiia bacterium]|nr:anti-sigma factor RsbA family regulatory protein [Acidimicrobiia bacterium]